MSSLKVAILGAGYMGQVHAKSWSKIPYIEVKLVYSRTLEKAKKLAEKYSAEYTASWKEAVSRSDIDIVDICLPTFLHKDVAIEALSREKHVLLEKPMAVNLEEAYEIIEAAKRSKAKIMVAHCLRFFPEYSKIKRKVDEGVLGEVFSVRAFRQSSFPAWGSEAWFKDPEKSATFFADLLIHDFDYIRWLISAEPKRIVARFIPRPVHSFVRPADYGVAKIFFENKVVAHVEGGWAMPNSWIFTMAIEVYGEKGVLEYNSVSSLPLLIYKHEGIEPARPDLSLGYELEIKHFAECVDKNKEPAVTLFDAYKALEMSLAAYKSALMREPVSLPLREVKE